TRRATRRRPGIHNVVWSTPRGPGISSRGSAYRLSSPAPSRFGQPWRWYTRLLGRPGSVLYTSASAPSQVAVPPEGFLALESPRESRGRRRLAGAGRAGAVGPVRGPRVGRPGFRLGPDASAAGCWSRRGVAARFRGPGAVKNGGRPIATTQERRSPVSLLQVAVRRSVWLFDMGAICGDGDLSAAAASLLRDVLESPVLLKVGYGLDNDLGRLAYTLPEALPDRARGVLDLRVLAPRALAGPVSGGLSGLSRAVLGKGLDKTEQVSDWARRPLREESSWCTRRRTRTCASACSTRSATATQRSRRGRWSP
ncbi:unnamed protein product, partial [Prorocentrum cordatum]